MQQAAAVQTHKQQSEGHHQSTAVRLLVECMAALLVHQHLPDLLCGCCATHSQAISKLTSGKLTNKQSQAAASSLVQSYLLTLCYLGRLVTSLNKDDDIHAK
jgi:hypothetical protein